MRRLGTVARLQVQTETVKRKGEGYDPTPILDVGAAAIGPYGIVGLRDGAWVVDVHSVAHPRAKGGGRRALSIGFTSHYDLMASRFGDAPLGCAGENVIVATDGIVSPSDLAGDVVVDGEHGRLVLRGARVATPCVEFTSFLLGRTGLAERTEVLDDLAFLDGGTRGYILEVSHLPRAVVVRVGDVVSVGRS